MARAPPRRATGPGGCDCLHIEDQELLFDCHSGDTLCTQCAVIVESHMLDQSPEWYGDTNARANLPGRYDEYLGPQLGTTLGGGVKKRYAEPDPHSQKRAGLKEIERLMGLMKFDSDHLFCQSAKMIFSDYADARKQQSRTVRINEMTLVAAGALYFGYKSHQQVGSSRGVAEICEECGVRMNDLTGVLKDYKNLLTDKPYHKTLFVTVVPEDLLIRTVDKIEFENVAVKNQVLKRSREMFETIRQQSLLEGRTPKTVLSAVLFRACNEASAKVTKTILFTACGVSNVIMNKAIHDLQKLL